MINSKVVYVGPFGFPDGGAAARRILGNCRTIKECGYDVVIASGQLEREGSSLKNFDGMEVISLNERTSEHLPKLLKYLKYFNMGTKTISWLDSLDEKPAAIILYSGYSPYLLRLIKWCRINHVPLVFDSVEWYEPKNRITTFFSPYYLNIEYAMRFLSPKTRNTIVISEYLEKHYMSKSCRVVRVPPTVNTDEIIPLERVKSDLLKLVYAGSPGHKDLLDNILNAVLNVNEQDSLVELDIAGLTENELFSYPAFKSRRLKKVPKCIICHGKVSHIDALNIVSQADFSVLLRPNQKYAMAGFPTKFVESLALGTPTISNLTSDLSSYLTHTVEGLVCDGFKSEDVEKQIRYALKLDDDELDRMRLNARKQAELSFDHRIYKDEISIFLKSLELIH